MPAGNITTVERVLRMQAIKGLKEDGKTDFEVSEELGMTLSAVKRNIKYLDELSIADLTPEEIGEKRAELYVELLEASEEAKSLFHNNKELTPKVANSWFLRWMDSLQLRMKLYGLDNVKTESAYTQVNNYYQREPETISRRAADKISDAIKKDHEARIS